MYKTANSATRLRVVSNFGDGAKYIHARAHLCISPAPQRRHRHNKGLLSVCSPTNPLLINVRNAHKRYRWRHVRIYKHTRPRELVCGESMTRFSPSCEQQLPPENSPKPRQFADSLIFNPWPSRRTMRFRYSWLEIFEFMTRVTENVLLHVVRPSSDAAPLMRRTK